MKKLLFSVLFMALVFTTSCNKDDDGDAQTCEQRVERIQAELLVYLDEATTENCRNYKAALQAYVDSDCPGQSTYQALIDGLGDCSNP
ncbi:hypothetical protein LS48_04635 [Aequorivita aquimaris]|uniref:Lipoprotein n=1 Tax=Aequorivita aquimaris TaxID=1548749 RepID=A0A137RKH1_9FLAO|nr:hypothetical protein [Aequorivita aquimaris]KXO00679.1 hypothetical protein LS48_04635 [Aequorivita aquimaris]